MPHPNGKARFFCLFSLDTDPGLQYEALAGSFEIAPSFVIGFT